ncbi:hypothetical protein B0H66DRAFT_565356 [Apodospora peruviana]|uniref:C2H2-type domain-containing protein n=1 Tax=Apodospora peruviana TaxID=516989 RepID=A0AAE0HZM8_9PEZI|nr:hypothetical protein B0H66DRAFT_565356 [Apodospora peruviana]
MFQTCAEVLVRNRRQRTRDLSRWERYALGKFYVCGEKNCTYDCDEAWHYRDEFVRHLHEHHRMDKRSVQKTLGLCEQFWDYKPPPSSRP